MSTGSANLDVVASAGSSLLRACAGSVKLFTSAVGSARIAPHIHPHIVRYWFGTVKNFPRVDQLLRVLAPGSPVCVARGVLSLHTLTTRTSPPMTLLFTKIYAPTLCTVELWRLNYVPRVIFGVYVLRRRPSCLSLSFISLAISRLHARAATPALTKRPIFLCPLPPARSCASRCVVTGVVFAAGARWWWQMVHVDEITSDRIPARSGCVGGRAGGWVRSALL